MQKNIFQKNFTKQYMQLLKHVPLVVILVYIEWHIRIIKIDTETNVNRNLSFIISVSAYLNSAVEFDITLEHSTNNSVWNIERGWRYKPDIVGGLNDNIPFTMMHITNAAYRYWRVKVNRANNNDNRLYDVMMEIKHIDSFSTSG